MFIALYNDEGLRSKLWRMVKKSYNQGFLLRPIIISVFFCYFFTKGFFADILYLRRNPLIRYREAKKSRGMAFTTDLIDWLGGYPFEVAKPDQIFAFFKARGFRLVNLKAAGRGHGNNEFVFVKCAE